MHVPLKRGLLVVPLCRWNQSGKRRTELTNCNYALHRNKCWIPTLLCKPIVLHSSWLFEMVHLYTFKYSYIPYQRSLRSLWNGKIAQCSRGGILLHVIPALMHSLKGPCRSVASMRCSICLAIVVNVNVVAQCPSFPFSYVLSYNGTEINTRSRWLSWKKRKYLQRYLTRM